MVMGMIFDALYMILAAFVGCVMGIMMFYLLERMHGMGYVSKRDFMEVADSVDLLDSRIHRIISRAGMEAGRAKKKETQEMLTMMLPSIIEKLPLQENVKEALKSIPPEGLKEILKMVQNSER